MTVPPDLRRFLEASSWWTGLSEDEMERVHREAFVRSYQLARPCAHEDRRRSTGLVRLKGS